ncbi:MAG: hypothetical protein JOZ69_22485 [Myxococcales bacterium]|nr:hypothetical protein [Myxococcales bacterium]
MRRVLVWGFGGFFLLGMIGAAVNIHKASSSPAAQNATWQPTPEASAATSAPRRTFDLDAAYGLQWDYADQPEKMRGTTDHYADLPSLNVKGHLRIQKTSEGVGVLLFLDGGQFWCPGDGCNMSVRFDSAPIEKIWCYHPGDNDTHAVFIANGPALIGRLKKTHHLIVEAQVFQAGAVQIPLCHSSCRLGPAA